MGDEFYDEGRGETRPALSSSLMRNLYLRFDDDYNDDGIYENGEYEHTTTY